MSQEPPELSPGRSLGPRKSHCQCLRTGASGHTSSNKACIQSPGTSTCTSSMARHDVCPHWEWCCCGWLMNLLINALWGSLAHSHWLRESTKTGNPGKSRTRLLLYTVLIGWFVFPGNYTLTCICKWSFVPWWCIPQFSPESGLCSGHSVAEHLSSPDKLQLSSHIAIHIIEWIYCFLHLNLDEQDLLCLLQHTFIVGWSKPIEEM